MWGEAQVQYGLRAGGNYSAVREIHGNSGRRTAFYVGGFAQIPIGSTYNQLYLRPELIYSQEGETNEFRRDDRTIEETYSNDYIAIPVLLKAYFSENDTEFFGLIGPEFGFMVSDKVKTDGTQDPTYVDVEANTFNFAATLGLGFSYLRKFEIEGRISYGFSDMYKNDPADENNNASKVSLGVSYNF